MLKSRRGPCREIPPEIQVLAEIFKLAGEFLNRDELEPIGEQTEAAKETRMLRGATAHPGGRN